MLPALLAFAIAQSPAATDAALSARVSQLFHDVVIADDADATHKAAITDVQRLFSDRGVLTIAQVGDEPSYTFAMLACETAPQRRDSLLENLRAAVTRHDLPADALTYCQTRTKQDRVKADAQPADFRRNVLPKLKANVDARQGDAEVYAMMYDRAATDEGGRRGTARILSAMSSITKCGPSGSRTRLVSTSGARRSAGCGSNCRNA